MVDAPKDTTRPRCHDLDGATANLFAAVDDVALHGGVHIARLMLENLLNAPEDACGRLRMNSKATMAFEALLAYVMWRNASEEERSDSCSLKQTTPEELLAELHRREAPDSEQKEERSDG